MQKAAPALLAGLAAAQLVLLPGGRVHQQGGTVVHRWDLPALLLLLLPLLLLLLLLLPPPPLLLPCAGSADQPCERLLHEEGRFWQPRRLHNITRDFTDVWRGAAEGVGVGGGGYGKGRGGGAVWGTG